MKRLILILTVLAGSMVSVKAQQSYSLKEAQEYAVLHAYSARKAEVEIARSKSRVRELIGTGLPQISAEGTYNNNVQVPTSVIPGEFFGAPAGTFIPVKFGVRHQATGAITANQLLFSGTYIVGLQAARAYEGLSVGLKERNAVQIRQDVANAYFSVIASQENVATLRKGIASNEQLSKEATAQYENGLADEQASDQARLNLITNRNRLESAEKQVEFTLNLLKFQMGLPQTAEISVSENVNSLVEIDGAELLQTEGNINENVDYKLALRLTSLNELGVKAAKSQYLPTLAAFATHQQNAFANKFNEFGRQSFFPASIIGLRLTVPIFSAGVKHQQVRQAQLALDTAMINQELIKEVVIMGQRNARIDYIAKLKTFDTQKEALALAQKLKDKTQIMVREGLSGSTEMATSENQFLLTQGAYIQAVIDVLNAKVAFQKAFNKLN
ncbi:MAG: TolC family protein [Bacteroidota bacterium]